MFFFQLPWLPEAVMKARDFAAAIADCDKVERSLLLPMQSGSDRILKAMRRGYTTELYHERVAILREAVPEIEGVFDVTDHAGGDNPYYQGSK